MNLNTSNLSQARLKEIVEYEPDTGRFTALVNRPGCKAGDVIGSIGSGGYYRLMIEKKRYQAHRLAFLWMTGEMPSLEVDHVNGVRSDNRWSNLRMVSRLENNRNSKLRKDNKSGVPGVQWAKNKNKWTSVIRVMTVNQHLGYFNDFFLAVCARKSAELLHGFHENHGRI